MSRWALKSWYVVGFTADADLWCGACAVDAYGEADSEGLRLDREGNAVSPVFADQAGPEDACGRCGAPLLA